MKTDKRSGFTMVEIIAVLVIIGIMVAVAAPKFINMTEESKNKLVLSGISEAKSSLNIAYSKAYLANDGDEPNLADVRTNLLSTLTSGGTINYGDITVTFTDSGTTAISLEADGIAGTKVDGGSASGTWTKPVQLQ